MSGRGIAPVEAAIASRRQHAVVDVADQGARAGSGAGEKAAGDVARAAGHVEQGLVMLRCDARDQLRSSTGGARRPTSGRSSHRNGRRRCRTRRAPASHAARPRPAGSRNSLSLSASSWQHKTMPELPEVETVVRGLQARVAGKKLLTLKLNRADLRNPVPKGLAARVEGRRVTAISRRAKYILMTFEDGGVIIAHLGMSGRLVLGDAKNPAPPRPHDHVVMDFEDHIELRFNDARRFGLIDYARAEALPQHPFFRHLGPEPLGNDFNGPALAARLKGKRTPLKAALLDQRVVAGLGNIYACESLYWAGLSPKRLARIGAGAARRGSGARHPQGAGARDLGRRLFPARLCPGLGRARQFPAAFSPSMTARASAAPALRLQKRDQAAWCKLGRSTFTVLSGQR